MARKIDVKACPMAVVASGDTYTHRHVLYQLGFQWCPAPHAVWIKPYPEGESQDDLTRTLKKLRGVTVTIEKSSKFH